MYHGHPGPLIIPTHVRSPSGPWRPGGPECQVTIWTYWPTDGGHVRHPDIHQWTWWRPDHHPDTRTLSRMVGEVGGMTVITMRSSVRFRFVYIIFTFSTTELSESEVKFYFHQPIRFFKITIGHPFTQLFLVIALYSGKNAKHAAVTDSSNIAAVSNIAVQLFERMYGPEFHVIPKATYTSSFLTKQFALLRPISFLMLMASVPRILTQY